MNIQEQAKRSFRRRLQELQRPDYFPNKVVAEARGALSVIPAEGLTPEVAKIRREVQIGADNIERLVRTAVDACGGALQQAEAMAPVTATASDRIGKAMATMEACRQIEGLLTGLYNNEELSMLPLAAGLLSWWVEWLKSAYQQMVRDQTKTVSSGGE